MSATVPSKTTSTKTTWSYPNADVAEPLQSSHSAHPQPQCQEFRQYRTPERWSRKSGGQRVTSARQQNIEVRVPPRPNRSNSRWHEIHYNDQCRREIVSPWLISSFCTFYFLRSTIVDCGACWWPLPRHSYCCRVSRARIDQ